MFQVILIININCLKQASAIAHIISSKADRSMVTEQLEGKAGIALEESIRIFMQQVANDIDTRDYRSGKIASCEKICEHR